MSTPILCTGLSFLQDPHLYVSDDIHRVVKECDAKNIVTVPALVPKIKEATVELDNIQVNISKVRPV